MLINKLKKYRLLFSGWSKRDVNIAYQMLFFLKKIDMGIDEFSEYAKYSQEATFDNEKARLNVLALRTQHWLKNAPKCPDCSNPLNVEDVNISKCTQIPNKKIKSTSICPDHKGCGFQRWNQKPALFHTAKVEKEFQKTIDGMTAEEVAELDIEIPRLGYIQKETGQKKQGGCREK